QKQKPTPDQTPELRAARAASDALWDWDTLTGRVWCSSRLAHLLAGDASANDPAREPGGGQTPQDGRTLEIDAFVGRVHPDDRAVFQSALKACVAEGVLLDEQCRVNVVGDGYRWFRIRGQSSSSRSTPGDSGGRVARRHVSGGLVDIDDYRRASESVRQQQQQLMQRQRVDAIDCLAGGIAHEFNNVLQAVGGYIGFAQETLAAGTQAYLDLAQARHALDRAAKLTRDLLCFAKADESVQGPVDINRVVSGLMELLRPVLGADIDLRLRRSPQPVTTRANLLELRQALLNLCINARDAMPEGRALSISAEPLRVHHAGEIASLQPGSYCRLMVTDTGCGIPAEHQPRVFDPFFTTTEAGRGTGLGLAAVYGFLQRSGGDVTLYSTQRVSRLEPGGTTFNLFLPIERGDEMSERDQRAIGERGAGQSLLIIEDDRHAGEVARRSLEDAGYRVILRGDGESGLEAYIEHADVISLALIDAVLPRLSGRRVYEEIRRLQTALPIVFCTGHDPASLHGDGPGRLGDAVLAKPFDRGQLLGVVQRLLADRPAPQPA
ncbi:MAG: ATP-binding protein, partial [Planctomycetota bacterium]